MIGLQYIYHITTTWSLGTVGHITLFILRMTMTVAVLNLDKTAATPRINGQGRQTKY